MKLKELLKELEISSTDVQDSIFDYTGCYLIINGSSSEAKEGKLDELIKDITKLQHGNTILANGLLAISSNGSLTIQTKDVTIVKENNDISVSNQQAPYTYNVRSFFDGRKFVVCKSSYDSYLLQAISSKHSIKLEQGESSIHIQVTGQQELRIPKNSKFYEMAFNVLVSIRDIMNDIKLEFDKTLLSSIEILFNGVVSNGAL